MGIQHVWSLAEEIDVLESIYIEELEVQRNDSGEVNKIILQLHPATGEDVEQRYVCMTLVLDLTSDYPTVSPDITIRNPRGIAEEELLSLREDMHKLCEDRKGGPVLYDLIELAKDSLTAGNIPHCPCMICLEHFHESEKFTKTECYHYFHESCLGRYITNMLTKTPEIVPAHTESPPEASKLVCPVCREEIHYKFEDFSAVEPEEKIVFKPSQELKKLQAKMAEVFIRQKANGGIIDVEEEKNKFLVRNDDVVLLAPPKVDKRQSPERPRSANERYEKIEEEKVKEFIAKDKDLKDRNQNRPGSGRGRGRGRGFYESKDYRSNRDSNNYRDNRDFRENRDRKDRDNRDCRENRDMKDIKGNRERKDFRDNRDRKDFRENRDFKENRDFRENRDKKDFRENRNFRENSDRKDIRENRDFRDKKDCREYRNFRENRDKHESRDSRDRKEAGGNSGMNDFKGNRDKRSEEGLVNKDGMSTDTSADIGTDPRNEENKSKEPLDKERDTVNKDRPTSTSDRDNKSNRGGYGRRPGKRFDRGEKFGDDKKRSGQGGRTEDRGGFGFSNEKSSGSRREIHGGFGRPRNKDQENSTDSARPKSNESKSENEKNSQSEKQSDRNTDGEKRSESENLKRNEEREIQKGDDDRDKEICDEKYERNIGGFGREMKDVDLEKGNDNQKRNDRSGGGFGKPQRREFNDESNRRGGRGGRGGRNRGGFGRPNRDFREAKSGDNSCINKDRSPRNDVKSGRDERTRDENNFKDSHGKDYGVGERSKYTEQKDIIPSSVNRVHNSNVNKQQNEKLTLGGISKVCDKEKGAGSMENANETGQRDKKMGRPPGFSVSPPPGLKKTEGTKVSPPPGYS